MSREYLKPIRLNYEATASIHNNISKGYVQINPNGTKTYVPYTIQEMGEMHSFISPSIDSYKRMKWTKTRQWKNRQAARKSKWKYHPTFKGLNTVPRG